MSDLECLYRRYHGAGFQMVHLVQKPEGSSGGRLIAGFTGFRVNVRTAKFHTLALAANM